ncbi:cytoskeletal protein binding protein [Tulasnella sp. 424]|nr:cytoskeletal protein binding protein [Tulasnella sp. 424]
MSRSKLDANPLPVDFMVALYDFQGRAKDELTIKEGQTLCLVEDNRRTDQWAHVRTGVDPSTPSGLVPWTYIKSKEALYRASALYSFARQMTDEVEMKMGQTMSVYGGAGVRLLVKLDDFNGQVGRLGLVPQNYVEEFRAGEKVGRVR